MFLDFNFDAFAHGQIKSKLWLCDEFKERFSTSCERAVFLGSWYGMLPFLMLSQKALRAQHLTMVDLEEESLQVSKKVLNYFEVEGVSLSHVKSDAHQIDYSSEAFRKADFVFNTSCEHMQGLQWFDRIPAGTKLVLQGTNMVHPEHIFPFKSLKDFCSKFPRLEVSYSGQLDVTYPTMQFERYMLFGEKR